MAKELIEKLRVEPGRKVSLDDFDPGDCRGRDKATAKEQLGKHAARLFDLQHLLYAEAKHSVLMILQAMDAAGKDGVIRSVMSGLNPQGCRVTSFKAPTAEDLAHDFLWRVHKAAPAAGEIGIFNRSHYEDVLIVRVRRLAPRAVWSRRFQQINDFERMLAENGTVILKFFLHISKDEQKKRFEERLADPSKHWKATPSDFAERKYWDDYQEAYSDAISRCSTEWAPWYVIPANRNWFRNLAVAEILVAALESLKLSFPKPKFDLSGVVIE